MSKKKVSVIGAGNVGATTAQRMVESGLADVVLVDVVEGLAEGKALDIMQSAPILGFDNIIEGTTDFKKTRDSEVIIITAGLARRPGMSRDDLLKKNANIMKSVIEKVAPLSPKAKIIIITNPLDVMCYVAYKYANFPKHRIIGMAGELDGARFSHFVRVALDAKASKMRAMVLGTHGDTMVPIPRLSKMGAKKIDTLFSSKKLNNIITKTKNGGAEIVSLLKSGSAYYAPSAAGFMMARSILLDERKLYCASVYLSGEYGIKDVFCGVPIVLGKKGIVEISDMKLMPEELEALQNSAMTVKANINKLGNFFK